MIIHTFPNGDEVHRFNNTITIPFKGKRKVLSTVAYNGGLRENLKTVYNYDSSLGVGVRSEMKCDNLIDHQKLLAEEIGLDMETTAGMQTGVHMKNVSIKELSFEHITVTAIVTGGIEANGGRVGDPATWVEDGKTKEKYKVGTINIMLYINGNLTDGTMARALVTATEAKTIACEELQLHSNYSRGLATGSGTDETIIIADAESEMLYTNAGKHSKLGELIGLTVKEAVKEALFLQTDVCEELQHNAMRRVRRLGINPRSIFQYYLDEYVSGEEKLDLSTFTSYLDEVVIKTESIVLSSLIAHLIDQMDWNLLSIEEVVKSCESLMNNYAKDNSIDYLKNLNTPSTNDDAVEEIMNAWQELTISELLKLRWREFSDETDNWYYNELY